MRTTEQSSDGGVRIELGLVLPEIADSRDACVERLASLVSAEPGIESVHPLDPAEDRGVPTLCLHFEPSTYSISQIERLVHAAGARISESYGHELFPLRAITSEDAGPRIEERLRRLEGVLDASVSIPGQVARVEFERGRVTPALIEAELLTMRIAADGAELATRSKEADEDHDHAEGGSWYERNQELAWSLVAGASMLAGITGEKWLGFSEATAIAFFAVAYGFGAWDTVRHLVSNLARRIFVFEIDLLMLLAAAGAAVLGEWAEGAFLLVLFSLAHALEHYALAKARGAIKSLAELAPDMARVIRGNAEVEVPIEQVRAGNIVVVLPAERIPVDGLVRSGRSSVNQAPITGESVPVEKDVGDQVFAGTVNGEGALEITTVSAAGDRTLDRVIRLVEEAQTQKAPTQLFTERFERVFVPVVLVADVALITLPPLLGIWDLSTSFYRGMALLVAASPCALALGTPAAVLAGIAQAARHGVLIKGGAYLESLGSLKAIALDKTGTLTRGVPEVASLNPFPGATSIELLRISAALERRSQHPLAEAVVRRAEADMLELPQAGDLTSATGRGVSAEVEGAIAQLGNLRFWDEDDVEVPSGIVDSVRSLQASGHSVIVARYGERWLGVIGVTDLPRTGVREVLDRLRERGIRRIVMLTGDNQGVGDAVGRQVGVDEVRAELLPEDKVKAIQDLLAEHQSVAMIGDGVNDAPALAQATVGIAMGGAGTAAALETADIALMSDDLSRLPFAVALSRQARSIIRQNLFVSLSVVALLIGTTATGVAGIGLAVAVHEGSTVVVVGNALRLLTFRPATNSQRVTNSIPSVEPTPNA